MRLNLFLLSKMDYFRYFLTLIRFKNNILFLLMKKIEKNYKIEKEKKMENMVEEILNSKEIVHMYQ